MGLDGFAGGYRISARNQITHGSVSWASVPREAGGAGSGIQCVGIDHAGLPSLAKTHREDSPQPCVFSGARQMSHSMIAHQ